MTELIGVFGPSGPEVRQALSRALGGEALPVLEVPGGALCTRGPASTVTRAGAALVVLGFLVPGEAGPALDEVLARAATDDDANLDGAFALVFAEAGGWRVRGDPLGSVHVYYARHEGRTWISTSLAALRAVPGLPWRVHPPAIHRYLTFSFVPGPELPIAGVRRVLPGERLVISATAESVVPCFNLRESVEPMAAGQARARVWRLGQDAVARRLRGHAAPVALALSGGIDSSAVGVWLRELGRPFEAFTLDFGESSVEREEAVRVAGHLGAPVHRVDARPDRVARRFDALIERLDLPYGDPVTGPHALLADAAREAGFQHLFNGEGGDQLFGGWTNKPMVAAAVYGFEDGSPEEQYLKSYHKFYGMEDALYAPDFAAAVGPPGQRRGFVRAWLAADASSFLHRLRLTDLGLKGGLNILPRAHRIAAGAGVVAHAPLFDRRLAVAAFRIPPDLKLHGACEKYVLKLAMQDALPEDIVWRRKFGMSVPITDWLTIPGPLSERVHDLLSEASVRRRGWFRPEAVAALRRGQDRATETRRRRLGERLWALAALEGWARRVLDGRTA